MSGGRPAVGTPVNIRLGDGLLALVDDYAKVQDISRAEAIRRLVQTGIGATPKSEFNLT